MTGENFPDSKDAFAIWDYVKEEYYGYSDGKVQTFADYVSASEALQEIRGRNMEAEKSLQLCSQNPQLRCSRIIALAIRCIWTERHLRLKSRAFRCGTSGPGFRVSDLPLGKQGKSGKNFGA